MKSYVTFSREQRYGIFLLITLIIVFQCLYFFIERRPNKILVQNESFHQFQKEIDSLRAIEMERRIPKIYPFNPNFITDYKGASLGMSNEEIDRLLAFRNKDNWINSTKQFQEVTGVSDSLLELISPHFKFPEWVANSKKSTSFSYKDSNKPKTFAQKRDLNTATAQQLESVNGVGPYFSERIIRLRNTFVGGFIADVQLQDVYGLTPQVIEKITKEFTVKTPRNIQKINLNKATKEELVTIQHIDYNLAHYIIEYRQLREGFKSLEELRKVKDFPINKIEIIELYLSLD
ncbi:competence protein ComEA [Pseudalgibacter alginicilyticus]|uniref:Competence protein ComEA n=1 Tax=Pseudalgibacter alginicilyticus TaxID=1736674 RepID=A0A0P0D9P5_9FLAO|nr:helix-hairpin-helix domain-containing protein [Pseudalgibacter alginicilyticus]ALJ04643.1 competence protein ComEA [Pseudalgibacter alginicilyticus]